VPYRSEDAWCQRGRELLDEPFRAEAKRMRLLLDGRVKARDG